MTRSATVGAGVGEAFHQGRQFGYAGRDDAQSGDVVDEMLELALHAARLKRVPRSGWQMRGAPLGGTPENVAAHSYGVAFLAMLLLDLDPRPLDGELTLRVALLHDLAESLLGDLPATTRRYLPREVKHAAEAAALEEILSDLPEPEHYRRLWQRYAAGEDAESRLVRDADRLDMMIQAYLYEQAGQRNLDDFWRSVTVERFDTAAARTLFASLLQRRADLQKQDAGEPR